jgi:glycosyltransferase involved in cell wall biosynthesis
MSAFSCSLIIRTYNWKEALQKCLQSVLWQTTLPGEVLIADDGSKPDTAEMIEAMKSRFTIPLRHFWHEDIKMRLTRINNIAISNAASDYLIFTDHDMILHPRFIEDHLAIAEKKYFVNGSRFLVNEVSTQQFLQKESPTSADLKKLEGKNELNRLHVPFLTKWLAHRYQTKDKDIVKVRGCNMSFWKEDLLAVNGFDERFIGWGFEDSDIAVRLYHYGVRKKSLKFGGIAYHLDHAVSKKPDDNINLRLLHETIASKTYCTYYGIEKRNA